VTKGRLLLDTLLEPGAISAVFQPIFECRGRARTLYALEGLIRGPKGTNMEDPEVLLEYVRRKREEARIDRVCAGAVLRTAAVLPRPPRLCVNVHASTLGRDPEFVDFLTTCAVENGIATSRLTVEIVEHAPPWDGPGFLHALEVLRDRGVRIALDDVGLGQSNYKMMLDARPEYFKIDRYFVQGAHADRHRQAVLESIAQLALRFGGRVVAEGVEGEADFLAVAAHGIDLVQGFLFSPPLSCVALAERNLLSGAFPPLPGAEPLPTGQ
jgi:EAL domain-containing protein (putative c-di-GMP-specific phosphodiesterase class I)